MRVAHFGSRNQFAGDMFKCGKQRDRSMTLIIVRHGSRPVGRRRQSRLGALQCLALAFLVAAQHQRVGGRIEIESDNVPEFFFEFRIIREFEDLDAA